MVNDADWVPLSEPPKEACAVWLKTTDGTVKKGWYDFYINHAAADHSLYFLNESGSLAAFSATTKVAWAPRIAVKTAAEVEQKFMQQLQSLLNVWGAELDAKDHWQGYAECREDVRMTVSIPAIYKDGECLREDTEINLGTFLQGKAK